MVVVVSKKGFTESTAKSFSAKIKGKIFKGFIVLKEGKFYAYQNLCRHLPVTLDLDDDDFFTHDKRHLQCQMHGAMYEVETGLCIAGPCLGARLLGLQLEEEETRLVIRLPEKLKE